MDKETYTEEELTRLFTDAMMDMTLGTVAFRGLIELIADSNHFDMKHVNELRNVSQEVSAGYLKMLEVFCDMKGRKMPTHEEALEVIRSHGLDPDQGPFNLAEQLIEKRNEDEANGLAEDTQTPPQAPPSMLDSFFKSSDPKKLH